ncbi:hypothetical protein KDA_62510 [Dictyobacter alpinus]|uniref:Uncharacterized protein n=1 Tax=Dictyobacter alpinus TaxID=2014873 RepID=A0A402BHN7_9CHLR|nr:hypothetical protein KDA_62510 [Dictyobacter alpinus]
MLVFFIAQLMSPVIDAMEIDRKMLHKELQKSIHSKESLHDAMDNRYRRHRFIRSCFER